MRELSKVLGTMMAVYPAIFPVPLHNQTLERARLTVLRQGLSYNAVVGVTQDMKLAA